ARELRPTALTVLSRTRQISRNSRGNQREGSWIGHEHASEGVRYRIRMKLTDDRIAGAVLVRSYSPGELRVGDDTLRRSCVLRADQLIRDWRPQTIEELTLADLDAVFALDPEIIVLGTGERQRFPATELLAAILSRGIGCEVMATDAACRTYNVLVSEDRRVVAALMLL
ncbi:MAG: Mth938-like domain-containing protein, partial [Steroidobacter sp.]